MKIEKTVDRGSREKLYVQIYAIFLGKIEGGEWRAGAQIPSEDELCKIYEVSKVTVREAIQELVREGYLKRQQGRGTFVTYAVPQPGIVMRTRLSEEISGEEVKVEKEVLKRGVKRAEEDIRGYLMTESEIYYILNKKAANEELYTEEFFIPMFVIPDIRKEDIYRKSLYDLIEEKGTKKVFKVTQTIELTKVGNDIAAILKVQEGSPALLISRTLISSDGVPIAYSRLIGNGRKYKFQMQFERIK